jgi:glycosyltransferase involved in cell wall biosynthesis
VSISIVLPLYNALSHLESGLRVIHSQTFPDWELVAVNDGSTDQTRERFFDLTKNWTQPVRLIDRENGGGFAARNTGLDHVSRRYIAFFDIDDIWYPHHLERLFSLMEGNPDVDWIYAACKLIDLTQGGKVVQASNFYQDGAPRPFLSLRTVPRGEIRLIDDERAAAVQFVSGLQIGQQFSLIRQRVFAEYRFRSDYRNEAADQVSVIAALKSGYRFAWLNEIHGEYVIHTGNASAGCRGAPLEKYLRLKRALIRGFKELDSEAELTLPELRALRERLSNEYFWALGYNLLLPAGLKSEALQAFRYGLFYSPFDLKKWKTFLLTLLRQ